ncbi:DUF1279 superfamily [Cryomyces antarcticus]|uniref:DUF1279 superfamily n=1 Tax=Cryomyces antarcticus TaxID=329879 RepID=A0ABR0M178_9PEZI|nr:DUF1279 superfamily [Cryomyces antarcticus]
MEAFRLLPKTTILRSLRDLAKLPSASTPRTFMSASRAAPLEPHVSLTSTSRMNFIISRQCRSSVLRQVRSVRYNSSKPPLDPTPHLGSPEPALSLSQRMRKLSREYGWSALGVYLLLSALDFPFCFLAVRWLGTDRIAHLEHIIVEAVWKVIEVPFPNLRQSKAAAQDAVEVIQDTVDSTVREGGAGWGVEEAEARNKSDQASLWTQLVLAYAIHKSFIFIRVPLTAAVTPKVVKVLRGWGWDIGKRKPKVKSNTGKGVNTDD